MAAHARTLRHLGVNAVFLEPRMGGAETYVRRLYPAIAEARPDIRISIFANELGRELLAGEWPSGTADLVTHRLVGRRGLRAVTETTILGPLVDRRGCDVLHSVALTAPLRMRAANVVTIADVTWLRQPGAVPAFTRLLWRTVAFAVVRRADRVIAHSEAARMEIAEDLRVPADRIDVVAHGPGADADVEPTPERELRERFGLGDGPIVLAVSALLAHKNVGALVEAMPEVRRAHADAVLVVPGNPTPLGDELAARARALGLEDAVVFPGWVSAADLEGLYAVAACFAFPSLREGFGLPVLEAMRRGLAVACSNSSAVPEVAGDAALYFDPRRPHEIATAVSRLLGDAELRRDLAERGRVRAAEFTWRRAAEETMASFERAVTAA